MSTYPTHFLSGAGTILDEITAEVPHVGDVEQEANDTAEQVGVGKHEGVANKLKEVPSLPQVLTCNFVFGHLLTC